MKRIPALVLIALAVLITVPGALAQGVALKANIPFGFNVGDTPMPPGDYTISSPVSGLIRIANDRNRAETAVAVRRGVHDSGPDSKLVFERYGGLYFLNRIHCPITSSMNVEIPEWNAEKKARSREAKLDIGERVVVAAR
jgi:hypothetical protein